MSDELERAMNWSGRCLTRYCPTVCLKELRKALKRSQDRDSNRASAECQPRAYRCANPLRHNHVAYLWLTQKHLLLYSITRFY
jgi:hypothetical protein